MEWLKDVTTTEANNGGASGLNHIEARALAVVLNEFMGEYSEVYDLRKGTIILDAQETILKNRYLRPSFENLSYGEAELVLWANLPGGEAKSMFFDSERAAKEAIDSLLDGRRFFTGHANASLDGNIYKTSGTDMVYESGRLMLLNTTYGRFLAGCGDSNGNEQGEADFILIAIARTILKMFPTDQLLRRGYDWMRVMCSVSNYHCDRIASVIDRIVEKSKAESLVKFREYYAEAQSVGFTPVPFYREPKVAGEESSGAWEP